MDDILRIFFSTCCRNLRHFRILLINYSLPSVHYKALIGHALFGLLVYQSIGWIAWGFHRLSHTRAASFRRVYSHGSLLTFSVRVLASEIIEILIACTVILKANWVWSIASRRMRGSLLWYSISDLRHGSDIIVVRLRSLFGITLIPSSWLLWRDAICTARARWLVDGRLLLLSVDSWVTSFSVHRSLWIASCTL